MNEFIKALFELLKGNKKLAIAVLLGAYGVSKFVETATGFVLTALGVSH